MNLFQPKVILAVTAIIVALILISLAQEVHRRWQTAREIQKLETEVHNAQKQVVELQNLNQYFSTEDYQERLAREKLNYQAPGEHVVAVPENQTQTATAAPTQEKPRQSIPLTWWKVFFVDDGSLGS
jgi:cell division protein FtsB